SKGKAASAGGEEGEESPAAKAKAFRDAMASINRDMMETIAEKNAHGVAGTGDPERIARAREKAADQIRSLVESSGLPEGGSATENALAKAAGLEKTAEDLRQKMMADSMKRVGKIREELATARERGDKEEEQRLNAERRQMEKRIRSQNRMLSAGQKSQEAKEKAIQKTADEAAARQTAIRDASIRKATTHAAAQGALADFLAAGGQITSETNVRRAGPNGPQSHRTVHAQRDFGGRREMLTATFDESGASVKKLTRNLSEARAEAGYLGGDFVKNTAKVTLWAASVGVLYKSLELATHSMTRVIEIGGQMARLDQVFRGVGGSTQQLTSDILHLAAVNGRSTQEALDSAIQWARLGLTRSQVNEAVRVSLMAANVAELSAADATEHLQAVMQNYQLQVGELRTVLGELNQISNTYNVTNAQMLDGISKTAAVAKQAGLPLSELMGLIGATVGATGQSGANIGNSIKTMITSLGNPELQAKLRGQFGFEASTGGEGLKSMSELLSDLYVKYQHLNEQQQASLRFQVAGKFQATRLAALLDNYVRAQTLAINAQLNLNSAETENTKIKDTLKSQLTGLASEWERFVAIQGNRGPVQVLTQMSAAMRNLLTLMNTSVGSTATTGIMGLLMAGGMKSVLTGMNIKDGGGFLSRSGNAVRGALGGLNQSMLATYAQFAGGGLATNLKTGKLDVMSNHGFSMLTARAGQQINLIDALMQKSQKWLSSNNAIVQSLGGVTRALGAGLIALRAWLVPMA
ncbi:MAG: phage tail tape measure protein, partial [Verrucomicrobiota bacterium]